MNDYVPGCKENRIFHSEAEALDFLIHCTGTPMDLLLPGGTDHYHQAYIIGMTDWRIAGDSPTEERTIFYRYPITTVTSDGKVLKSFYDTNCTVERM